MITNCVVWIKVQKGSSAKSFWILNNKEMERGKDSRAQPSISLKMIVLSVPKGEKERSLLEEDLQKMGCHGLLKQP